MKKKTLDIYTTQRKCIFLVYFQTLSCEEFKDRTFSIQFSSVQIFHMLKLSKCIYITIRDTFKKMLFFKHQSPKCTYFFKMVLSTQIIDSCTIQILTAKLGQLQLKAGKINFCYMHLHSIKAIFQIKWF